jgi:hypothetical protein
LTSLIQVLVYESIKTESLFANNAIELRISKTLFESW